MLLKFIKLTVVVLTCFLTGNPSYCENNNSKISDLISKLNSTKYSQRESATNELIKLGYQAIWPLRNSLTKNISLEQKKRIKKVLSKIEMPTIGYEYVGFANSSRSIKGLSPGDVIIKIGSQNPIEVPDQRVFYKSEGEYIFTIWISNRNVKNRIKKLRVKINKGDHVAFLNRVGCASEYLYTGHRGKWDAIALEAILASYTGQWERALVLGNKAFEAGCRDASVYHRILHTSINTMRFDVAKHYIKHYSKKLKGNLTRKLTCCAAYPGILNFAIGNDKLALNQLKLALENCKKNHILDYAHLIKKKLVGFYLDTAPEKVSDFMLENYNTKRSRQLHPCYKWFYISVIIKLSSCDFKFAAKLLTETINNNSGHPLVYHYYFLDYLKFQQGYFQKEQKSKKLYPVLYHCDNNFRKVSTLSTKPSILNLPRLLPYSKVDVEIKINKTFPTINPYQYFASLIINNTEKYIFREISKIGITQDFEVSSEINLGHLKNKIEEKTPVTIPLRSRKVFYKLSILTAPFKIQTQKDNQPMLTNYHLFDDSSKSDYLPYIKFHNCSAEIKNIRYFALSTIKFDNKLIESLLKRMTESIHNGKLKKYISLHDKLMKIWSREPALKSIIKKYNDRLEIYKKIFSKTGWSPTASWILSQHQEKTKNRFQYFSCIWDKQKSNNLFYYTCRPMNSAKTLAFENSRSPIIIDIPLPKDLIFNADIYVNSNYPQNNKPHPFFYLGIGLNTIGNFNSKLISKSGPHVLLTDEKSMMFTWKPNSNKFLGKKINLNSKIDRSYRIPITFYNIKLKMISDSNNNCTYFLNDSKNPILKAKYDSSKLGTEIMLNPKIKLNQSTYINFNNIRFKFYKTKK